MPPPYNQPPASRPFVPSYRASDADKLMGPYPAASGPQVTVQPQQPTGQEGSATAIGNFALNFLQGLQQGRAQQFEKQQNERRQAVIRMDARTREILENPDIDEPDKQRAQALYNSYVSKLYEEEAGNDTKKNPVLRMLGGLLKGAAGGAMPSDEFTAADGKTKNKKFVPAEFFDEFDQLRGAFKPVSQKAADAEKMMIDGIAKVRAEKGPMTDLSEAFSNDLFRQGHSEWLRLGRQFNPMQFGLIAPPADPVAVGMRSRFREMNAQQIAEAKQAEATKQYQDGLQQAAPFAGDPSQASADPLTALQGSQAPPAVRPTAAVAPPNTAAAQPGGVQPPASAGGPVPQLSLIKSPGFEPVYASGVIPAKEITALGGIKKTLVDYFTRSGTKYNLVRLQDPLSKYDGMVVDMSNPNNIRAVDLNASGLSDTLPPGIKDIQTPEQMKAVYGAYANQLNRFIQRKELSVEDANALMGSVGQLLQTGQKDDARHAFDTQVRAMNDALERKDRAKNSKELADATRSFQQSMVGLRETLDAGPAFRNSSVGKQANEAIDVIRNVRSMYAAYRKNPTDAAAGAFDTMLIIDGQKLSTPGSVQIGEFQNWSRAVENLPQSAVRNAENFLKGESRRLSNEGRAIMVRFAESAARARMETAMQEANTIVGTFKSQGIPLTLPQLGVTRSIQEVAPDLYNRYASMGSGGNAAPPASRPGAINVQDAVNNRGMFQPATKKKDFGSAGQPPKPPQAPAPAKGKPVAPAGVF